MKTLKETLFLTLAVCACAALFAREKWTETQANEWYAKQPYLAGANFTPRYAINQIEMFSAETFNPKMIDEELSWAQDLGFNTMRVFLHDLLWEHDREGFFQRLDTLLEIADSHGIRVMFVIFDSCWNPVAKMGKQPEPRKYLHNSAWLQSPTLERLLDKSQWEILERYVKDLVGRYKDDKRVLVWDLFNEPCQQNGKYFADESVKIGPTRELLKKVFEWARSANPSQPLTAGVFSGSPFTPEKKDKYDCNEIMFAQSDVISFHTYGNIEDAKAVVEALKRFNRPMFCTEYMARPKSTFDPILGFFKDSKVAAYNWGFVAGKTNTIYPWDSWKKQYTEETLPPWFHDVLKPDGTPYDKAEADYIKSVLKAR